MRKGPLRGPARRRDRFRETEAGDGGVRSDSDRVPTLPTGAASPWVERSIVGIVSGRRGPPEPAVCGAGSNETRRAPARVAVVKSRPPAFTGVGFGGRPRSAAGSRGARRNPWLCRWSSSFEIGADAARSGHRGAVRRSPTPGRNRRPATAGFRVRAGTDAGRLPEFARAALGSSGPRQSAWRRQSNSFRRSPLMPGVPPRPGESRDSSRPECAGAPPPGESAGQARWRR